MMHMPTGTRSEPGPLTLATAAKLRGLMAEKALKGKDVAESTGIPPSTLSRLLNGRKPIYLDQLDAICAAVGTSVAEVTSQVAETRR
jgi:DNA-binding Xre family transcriptional regulator